MMSMWLEPEEEEKEKASKVSWVVATYLEAFEIEKLERKMTATPPPCLPLSGKDLMETPEGVKSAMICSSPIPLTRSP